MKAGRFAILLAGLLLISGLPIEGKTFTFRLGGSRKSKVEVVEIGTAAVLAKALAKEIKKVHETFITNRNALRILRSGTAAGYMPGEVTGLIVHTREDLDQAIQRVGKSDLEALSAWSDAELQRIQGEIPPPGPIASLPGPSSPRAFAVFASSRGFGLTALAKNKPAPKKSKPASPKTPEPPKPQTIPVAATDRLLDQVEEVIRKIFVLADTNDLWVDLWVGSTPSDKAIFSFWPHGTVPGSEAARAVIKTYNRKKHIVRGFYDYQAAWGRGAVIQKIEYPDSAAQVPSERLDLVKDSPFFCCEFKGAYCHHVDNERDCR
jgi:hypothetical protein